MFFREIFKVSSISVKLLHRNSLLLKKNNFSHVLSPQNQYRNRYTHHRDAYPGKGNFIYPIYGVVVISLIGFLTLGGGLYMDNLEAAYILRKKEERKKKISKVDCQSHAITSENDQEKADRPEEKVKKRIGFRDRKFIAYEDRIRAFSTPDKIFRYFATLKSTDEDGEIYMTPDDFLRAITPGIKQPDGLDLDSFRRFDPKTNTVWFKTKDEERSEKLELNLSQDSVFYHLCSNALISFTDFVFLLTVLSTPRRQFEIAFRMFDLNGDGELDANEFDAVRSVIMDTTHMGRRHRDHSTTGSTLKRRSNSALQHYFFGPNRDQKLPVDRFLEFHKSLQEEITKLEFERSSPNKGKITEIQFSQTILAYTGFSEQRRRKLIRNVKHKFSNDEDCRGISYKEFSDFNLLLRSISDVDTALTFHHMAGAAIDQDTLIHVARTVANVELSPHLVDVVFTLFDENNDGQLSHREFVGVMQHRLLRGLDKPMDTGFVRFVSALFTCARDELFCHRSSAEW